MSENKDHREISKEEFRGKKKQKRRYGPRTKEQDKMLAELLKIKKERMHSGMESRFQRIHRNRRCFMR